MPNDGVNENDLIVRLVAFIKETVRSEVQAYRPENVRPRDQNSVPIGNNQDSMPYHQMPTPPRAASRQPSAWYDCENVFDDKSTMLPHVHRRNVPVNRSFHSETSSAENRYTHPHNCFNF